MAANGRLVWVPAGVKGLRIPGWENKIKNMTEDYTSDYATLSVYILDDIDPAAAAQGNAAQLKHARFCNNMRNTFNDTVADCMVKSIRMQRGQRSKHILEKIEAELRHKTKDDLVVFCFQGTAGGDGNNYNFNLTGPGPNQVNAHKLISKVNESNVDCLFVLDCWFPTHSIEHWRRKDHMTEIILAGNEMHDTNGRAISGPENFDEAFASAMQDILANPRGESRQTIPRILCRDKTLCSKPLRHWLNRPDRFHPENRVWRFFVDIGRLRNGDVDKLQIRRCQVTGRRKGEFGGDPDLDNDGWGSDGGSDGGGSDGDDGDDSDSSNGGWRRGFGRTHRRASPRKDNAKNGGESVARRWAQLRRDLGLPKKLNNREATNIIMRLDGLPRHLKSLQRVGGPSHELPTPSSSGIRKKARGRRPTSLAAGARVRSEVVTRPNNRHLPVSPEWGSISTQRVGHKLGRSIVSSGIGGNDPASARRERIRSWPKDFVPKSTQDPFSEEDHDKAFIKRSGSPDPNDGGGSSSFAGAAAEQEMSPGSNLEITSARPLKPSFGGGEMIDLTDTCIDLTSDDPDSLFIPEHTNRGNETA